MATKAQLISFIMEKCAEPSGEAITKAKLDAFKKAELEEFIKNKGLEDSLKAWLAEQD